MCLCDKKEIEMNLTLQLLLMSNKPARSSYHLLTLIYFILVKSFLKSNLNLMFCKLCQLGQHKVFLQK